ncbi:MAG: 16S rRNA (uracil(1498)-N(3))-methyltransferase [Chroococcidiopsidaceae cyanobacterium CP_BM_RX_35]|nr:16S rRNA (uracil(1498)-N(3))-methyltransferase [Chroococcidiopsidaceae cyanobacterium CP_BM_RX_35]
MAQLQRLVIAPSQFQEEAIALTLQQQHYLAHVLRLRSGDRFIAMDGLGHWWLVRLENTEAKILEQIFVQTELPIAVTLIVALPKGNGFDEVVRCCTELGVTSIAPAISDRTLPSPSPQKQQRWQRIAQEAAEQSERQIVPTILAPVPFRTSLLGQTAAHRYLCVARGNYPYLLSHLSAAVPTIGSESVTIATGPEGGWTDSEIEDAIAAGFQPVSLGRRILRAVTAPVVALSLVMATLEHA